MNLTALIIVIKGKIPGNSQYFSSNYEMIQLPYLNKMF